MNSDLRKKAVLSVLLLIIAFPFVQHSVPLFESGALGGAITRVADPVFSFNTWWDGSYQRQKNAYLNDNTGCRPDMVRFNNEIDYLLFNKLHANGVVIGKDQCIYERQYIDEYCGTDFLGDTAIRKLAIKLKKVQDTLEHLGKTFVFVYAPSKAHYFPDKFPTELDKPHPQTATNYAGFKRLWDSAGIHSIDFNAWFLAMKDTSRNQLFSRVGTHWTVYGSLLSVDSLVRYLENRRHVRLPQLQFSRIEYSDIARQSDNDLAVGLNLITEFKGDRFSYPHFFYKKDFSQARPKAIYIGDSFLCMWIDDHLMQNVNKDWYLWYYFNERWTEKSIMGQAPVVPINSFDWQKEMLETDCIIVLYTPANFKGLNYEGSFIEKMYAYFYAGKQLL